MRDRALERRDGVLDRRVGHVPRDHDLRRVGGAARVELLNQRQERLAGGELLGERADVVRGAAVKLEEEPAERAEDQDAPHEEHDRPRHDRAGEPVPEAALRVVGGVDARPLGQPRPVDPVAEQAEDRGQERHRGGEGADRDEDRAAGEAPEHRHRDDQHPEESEHHGEAAEEDRAARGAARATDRLELLEALLPLFAVARDDEQRVVDADRQADHRDHVLHEHVEVEQLADERDQAERDTDREQAHQEGQDRRHDRAEHDDQDDQGDEQADRLRLLHVLIGELHEVGEEGGLPGDLHRVGLVGVAGRDGPQIGDDRLRLVDDRDGDEGRLPVRRDERARLLHGVEPAVRGCGEVGSTPAGHGRLDRLHGGQELDVAHERVRMVDEDEGLGRIGLRPVRRSAARQLGELLGGEHRRLEALGRGARDGIGQAWEDGRGIAADLQDQQRRVVVGEQLRLQGLGVRVGRHGARDHVRAERLGVRLEALDVGREVAVPGRGRGLHDEELRESRRAPELLVDHGLGPGGLGLVGERHVVGQDPGQQPGAQEAHGEDEGEPGPERSPGVPAADGCERLRVELHRLLPSPGVSQATVGGAKRLTRAQGLCRAGASGLPPGVLGRSGR